MSQNTALPPGKAGLPRSSEGVRLDPARALRHPLWWGALSVLLLNDHVLKGAGWLPGSLTGKLSDVAGLIVAPVLLAVLLRVRSRAGMWMAIASVGAWLSVINVVPAAARGMEQLTALVGVPWTLWCDPTDLLALPVLGASAWLMLSTAGTRAHKPTVRRRLVVERLLAIAGAVSCMATSTFAARPPVTTPGKVLSESGNVTFVVDSATGRRLATANFDVRPSTTIEVGGVIYGVFPKSIVGLSVRWEREVFNFEYDGGYFHRLVLTDGSRLFMIASGGGSNERLVAVDLKSGKLAWDKALPGREPHRGASAKAPLIAGGLIVVPVKNQLVAFDPGTGARRWAYDGGSDLTWTTSDERAVYVVNEAGTIVSIDMQHGNVLWQHAVGSFDGFRDRDGPRFNVGSGVMAFVRGDKLIAVEADTRAPRWVGPAVKDVVVGKEVAIARVEINDDDHFVAIRMTDGKRLWKLNVDAWPRIDPMIDEHNGLVLINMGYAELRAYTMNAGRLQWRFLNNDGERADDLYGRVQLTSPTAL